MSKQTYSVCFCFRRRFHLAEAEAPAEIRSIFNQYSENGVMSVANLHRFLIEVQKEENGTVEDAQALADSLHYLKLLRHKGLNLNEFFKYISSGANSLSNPKIGIHHDMNSLLSHYFIYTGHNSYLTGNQLSSDCSDAPIIQALQRGVRVIELDIWPNKTKNNVDVLHGRTLTAPVALSKCLKSIKEYAFSASDYPLIITLEDHLTPDLQAKVAQMIKQTFGDMLYSPGTECLKEFPSPESLKKRVIISTKPPKEYQQTKEVKEKTTKESSSAETEAWGSEVSDLTPTYNNDKTLTSFHQDGTDDVEDDDEEDPKSEQNEAPQFRNLIAIHAGKGKGGLSEWLRIDTDKVRRLSLSEPQLENAVKTHGKEIIRFTQQNLLRIYPKGIRINSSNYNPLIGWTHGAQMVAFNMQGHGRSLWLMQGMFRANGGCGYVKKPAILLESDNSYDLLVNKNVSSRVKTTLKVTVYMGEGWHHDFRHTHFDAYSPPDFYAKVGIAGVPADSVMKKTKIVENNWIPTWNENFEFPLTVPELALLRLEVHEYDSSGKDDFAGQTCIPISELRQGIRAAPLHDRKGDKLKSVKLLLKLDFL
ncbi:hypothetical protein DM860_003845 [Cuscuta australis]|uniref:Phosphoinositide phospholipase C n=1 Tax=Cuscuta australis TaxID=267555 RepID=A0A328CZ79_9ASTE|nr:hypothetical protein DM860_003845 [Cuscuta australis]